MPVSRAVVPSFLVAAAAFTLLPAAAGAQIRGQRLPGSVGIQETTESIAARQEKAPPPSGRLKRELEGPDRDRLPQNPDAPAVATWPPDAEATARFATEALAARGDSGPRIHSAALSFDGATLTDTSSFPPDSMGAVGPTQFVVFVNGRLRTFDKTTGIADGVINANPDVFFSSVMTPVTGSVVDNFTSDPLVRYDRFTARWILGIIDVPCTDVNCSSTAANRILLAVSDAASNGTITNSTVWTFFQFVPSSPDFCDYPSLGVDVNALYLGCNMFSNSSGGFIGTTGYVVRKSTALGAGPLTVTAFNLVTSAGGSGPYSPRGVDNVDATATEGYFVGVDNATFSTLMFRRVSNPGSATPTISSNISLTVPLTQYPDLVEHAGNSGGTAGRLDSLDDRIYAAVLRNGRLWAAHNILTTNAGVATGSTGTGRTSTRWYEVQNLSTTPTLVQSGTVYDSAATRAAARQYFIPSVTVTGQGHAVLGFTMAGVVGATPAYVGRLSGDTPGTMAGPPGSAAVSFGSTTSNYNPPSDPGGAFGRRWGDYSFTSVDPLDDMTVWTIQEYNQASNSYAVRVAKLAAPPPATPSCSGSPIALSGGTGDVVLTATSSGGSGFFDPGADLAAPALPFTHLAATMTNGTVHGVTYDSPTQVTLHLTTSTAGLHDVTVTNPDGQSVTATGCLDVAVGALLADGFESGGAASWNGGAHP